MVDQVVSNLNNSKAASVMEVALLFYMSMCTMYCMEIVCPIAIRLTLSYLKIRLGHIFFQILEAGEVMSVKESTLEDYDIVSG